ncbi:hypothetical protein CPB86DRAFT_675702, partial [Serendipita vermifera]
VIEHIGPTRFSGVASDNTGNTRKARQLICAAYPWIINMIDSPHFLSRTLSDVCELDAFSEAIATTLSVLTFFSHSTQATTHLTRARGTLDISRGLEKIGKTRFGTVYHSSNSILRCTPAIEKVVKSGLVTSKEIVPWFSHNEEYKTQIMQYRLHLMQLVNVCAPLAKSLRCLEAPESTCSDVLLYWLASAAVLKDLFS